MHRKTCLMIKIIITVGLISSLNISQASSTVGDLTKNVRESTRCSNQCEAGLSPCIEHYMVSRCDKLTHHMDKANCENSIASKCKKLREICKKECSNK